MAFSEYPNFINPNIFRVGGNLEIMPRYVISKEVLCETVLDCSSKMHATQTKYVQAAIKRGCIDLNDETFF